MSTLEVNKITPVGVGTSVTLGDSGDTFTIPSGVTLTNNGTATGFGGGKIGQVVLASTNTQLGANNANIHTFNFQGTITPSATNSKILVLCTVNGMTNGGSGRLQVTLRWDTTSGGTSGTEVTFGQIANDSFDTSGMSSLTLQTLISPNTTSQIYIKSIVLKGDTTTQWYVQRYSNPSYMTLMEVLA